MRAAIYARVSTDEQNCDMQLRELREYCQRRDWPIAGEYVDQGWSGAKASRPEFDRLMGDARARRCDVVLVWKLDRWGRSVQHCLSTIAELSAVGVKWLAVTQGIGTEESSPVSQLLLTILAAVAQFEREMIRERVKAGLAAAKHRGVRHGRPPLQIDKRRILRLRKAGQSQRRIAALLGVGKATIARVLAA